MAQTFSLHLLCNNERIMREIMNIQQWWDSFHPIDRKSICLHFDLQEYLANKDYNKLPPHIKVMLMNQWISNDSIVHNTTEWQF